MFVQGEGGKREEITKIIVSIRSWGKEGGRFQENKFLSFLISSKITSTIFSILDFEFPRESFSTIELHHIDVLRCLCVLVGMQGRR